ncbi:pentapeptide repeat-containing protein [Spiroplasma phoeniceum]|uniref:Pentapeptide repeat-containing protein n=1 Tax=Spiroplasma phoeniceum P40 TaxID=1276259 RepID=A0A345DN00_9MOLU|nr:pentapeptide repeat-containing protein [Spiroplasma phoeniceum]AXF95588.1 hypothetical protein SDAV_00597 [Spiroplasma phoeniceum P40]
MKTLQELIKELTGVTVEKQKINEYLEYETLDLQGVYLRWTNLQGANLTRADLRSANLQEAKLQGANLWCADLRSAYLSGARITKKQLDQLIIIEEDK